MKMRKILILITSILDFGNAYKFTGGNSCIDNDKQCDFLEQISLKDSCTSSNCKSNINKERVWFYGHEFNTNKVFVHANGHTTFGDDEIDFGTKSSFGQATMRSYGSRGFPYVNLPYFKCFSDEMIEIIEYEFYWTLSNDCRHEAQEVQDIIDEYFDDDECKTYFEVIWKTCVREDSTIHDDFSSIIVSSTDYTLIINHYENLSEINAEVLVVGVAGGEFTKSWFSFDINQTENADHKATLFLGSLQKSSNMVGERKGYWAWSSEQQEEQETPSKTCPKDGPWEPKDMHNRSYINLQFKKCTDFPQYSGNSSVVRACAIDPNGRAVWTKPYFDECLVGDLGNMTSVSSKQATQLLNAIAERFGALDNLKPEDANQLISEVEDIMDKIDVSEEKFDLVLENLLISVDLMSRYVTFGDTSIVTRSTLSDSTFKCGLAEEAKLDLGSKSLTQQLNSTAENRVKCAIYANASIFATNASQTTTGEAISFSIGNYKIEDLNGDDRIQLVFSRDSTRRGANRNWDTCNYWDMEAQEWTDSGCIKDVRQSTKDKTVCKCNHFTNFAALYTPFRDEDSIPEAHNLNMTTYIGSALSIACLLATLGIHLWFEKLRSNAQKRILISLCFALLGRDACILAIGFSGTGLASCECKDAYFKAYAGNETESSCGLIEKRNDTIGDSIGDVVEAYRIGDDEWMKLRYEMNYCPQLVTAAAFAQYFITAVFFWMACEGVHLYYSVAVVLNKPRSKYITKLSIVGWGMPLLFTVIVLIVEATTGKGYKLNFEYARDEAIETNFWIFLDDTMYYVFILTPFVLIWLFNMVMFGMVLSALINSQSNVVKTFQRISNFLSMKPDEKRKTTRAAPPKLSRNLSNNATKNHQKRLQGMIGLLTILGGAQIMMLLLADPSSNNNALSFIFIILNGLQGVFIFIFYVLLREDVLKTMGFAIKPRKEKPTITQKRSGLTDSSILDQTPSTEIPEEKFFQAISQKSSSNISTKPIGNSPKLLRNRHVFWKSPTIRPDTADGPRGKSERHPPEAGQNLITEKRTVKTTSSLPTFGSSKDPAIEDFRR